MRCARSRASSQLRRRDMLRHCSARCSMGCRLSRAYERFPALRGSSCSRGCSLTSQSASSDSQLPRYWPSTRFCSGDRLTAIGIPAAGRTAADHRRPPPASSQPGTLAEQAASQICAWSLSASTSLRWPAGPATLDPGVELEIRLGRKVESPRPLVSSLERILRDVGIRRGRGKPAPRCSTPFPTAMRQQQHRRPGHTGSECAAAGSPDRPAPSGVMARSLHRGERLPAATRLRRERVVAASRSFDAGV